MSRITTEYLVHRVNRTCELKDTPQLAMESSLTRKGTDLSRRQRYSELKMQSRDAKTS